MKNYRRILEERFVYVGVAEVLQTSVDTLANKLRFPSMQVSTKNVSPRNENVPAGAKEEFIKNNPLEMTIYEYALENFEKS